MIFACLYGRYTFPRQDINRYSISPSLALARDVLMAQRLNWKPFAPHIRQSLLWSFFSPIFHFQPANWKSIFNVKTEIGRKEYCNRKEDG